MKIHPLAKTNLYIALWLVMTANLGFFKHIKLLALSAEVSPWKLVALHVVLLAALLTLILNLFTWWQTTRPVQSFFLMAGALGACVVDLGATGLDTAQLTQLSKAQLLSDRYLLRMGMLGVLPSVLVWMQTIPKEPLLPLARSKLLWMSGSLALLIGGVLAWSPVMLPILKGHRALLELATPLNVVHALVGLLR